MCKIFPENGNDDTAYYIESESNTTYLWSSVAGDYEQICFAYPDVLEPPSYMSDLTDSQKNMVIDWFNNNNDLSSDILEAQIIVKTTKQVITYATRSSNLESIYANDSFPFAIKGGYYYGNTFAVSGMYSNYSGFKTASFPGLEFASFFDSIINVNYYAETISSRYKDGGMYEGLFNAINNAFSNYINVHHTQNGTYSVKFHINEVETNGGVFNIGYKYSILINIIVTSSADTIKYYHSNHILKLTRGSATKNSLFELYKVDDGLKFKVSNLLINYKNEPAIKLELTFAKKFI